MSEAAFLTATRTAYDTVAVSYADLLHAELGDKPFDRAMLAVFAERVRAAEPAGPVADIGCGPGRVTAHLHMLGVDAFGIDLSPAMIAVARSRHPRLRFSVGSMTELALPEGGLAGIVAWYSLIHVPPDLHAGVFAGFHRALAPGGHLLLAFQAGDERRHLTEGYGHRIVLDTYRLPPDRIGEQLQLAGLPVHAQLIRDPTGPEKTPQAYLLARKPGP